MNLRSHRNLCYFSFVQFSVQSSQQTIDRGAGLVHNYILNDIAFMSKTQIEDFSTNIIKIICLEKLGGLVYFAFSFFFLLYMAKGSDDLVVFQGKCGTFSVNDSSEHFSSRGW